MKAQERFNTHRRVFLEFFNSTGGINTAADNPEAFKSSFKNDQEISILREDNCLRSWIILSEPY